MTEQELSELAIALGNRVRELEAEVATQQETIRRQGLLIGLMEMPKGKPLPKKKQIRQKQANGRPRTHDKVRMLQDLDAYKQERGIESDSAALRLLITDIQRSESPGMNRFHAERVINLLLGRFKTRVSRARDPKQKAEGK